MGAACAPQAHVPRGAPRREERSRLLRVRRDGEEGTSGAVDPPELVRADTAKAAIWGALSGIALLVLNIAPSALQPPFYFAVVAIGYGLMLPVLAVLHARHQRHRESGAILGSVAGTSVVVLGIVAAVDPVIGPGALFVRGVWWWTIGKTWSETGLLPRTLGVVTMGLAVFSFVGCLIPSFVMAPLDIVLGLWMLVLSLLLWRARDAR